MLITGISTYSSLLFDVCNFGCITAGIHTGNTLEICSCKGHIFIRKLAIQNE